MKSKESTVAVNRGRDANSSSKAPMVFFKALRLTKTVGGKQVNWIFPCSLGPIKSATHALQAAQKRFLFFGEESLVW